jgi:fatty acid CoA ligase FadD9
MTENPIQTPKHVAHVLDLASGDTELARLIPDPKVEAAMTEPGISYQQFIDVVLTGYASRPAMGERVYEVAVGPASGRRERVYLPRFRTITRLELRSRITSLASAWRKHEQHRVEPGDFVCMLGFSGTDYAVIDLACAYAQAVSVPLQTTLSGFDLDGIFADTAPTAVAARVEDLVIAAELAGRHESVRSLIAFDYDERVDDDRERFAAAQTELLQNRSKARLVTLSELIASGDFEPWTPLPPHPEGDRRIAALVHSSGSTGKPKGVIVLERTLKSSWGPGAYPVPVVRMAFAPMNHLAGRSQAYNTLGRGGTVYFTSKPDLSELFDEIRMVRPTELLFFPRALEMAHRHFLSEVTRRSGDGRDRKTVEREVMEEMRHTFFGDRICSINVSTAPITPEVRQFVTECFQVPVIEAYGATETGVAVTVENRIQRPQVIDYRLRDVPELGYYSSDKPFPRGELCVKTVHATPGYFKRPEATAGLFDQDGFLQTGDIVEERAPDHVVIIDRRNDVLKLSQGEFVPIGALGSIYENGSDVIQQMYAYGNSARSFVLAVIVPNLEVVESRLGPNPSDAALKALIRDELKRVAQAQALRTFEIPRDFIIEKEPFTHENGLLTSVHKKMRPALKARYGDRLEELYVELERKQNDELGGLRTGASDLTVAEKVAKALAIQLGIEKIDPARPLSFGELGGDSLGAAEFSALLEEIFGVELSVNAILSPAGNIDKWARAIEAALGDERAGIATFDQIHGEGSQQISADELDVGAFIDDATLVRAPFDAPPEVSRCVLLTGATGFLGRFLCIEWAERMAKCGGKLVCLVRAPDVAAARRRLAAPFEGGDEVLEKRFRAASEHIEVVVGEVAEPRLGLDPATFDRLAAEVDHIVHPAALVNHVLPYEDLFGPNVAGTAELVRLALTTRQKRFDFVSSVAAAYLLERSTGIEEDTPLRHKIALTGTYGSGYGASKWAAEQLLHSAHRRFGLPVNIYRGDMMLAHRGFQGQINVPDVFTRLLYSVVMTGLAPKSFYQLAPDGSRQRAHYDGLPVDFIAAALVGIGAEPHGEIRTFHVVNHHHDDGLSLDAFVDWIEGAGYPVEREPDYGSWLRRFEAKLRALPEEKRQRSSLGVLESLGQPKKPDEPIGSGRFVAAVGRLEHGNKVPHLDHAFITKCLDDLQRLGLIPPPKAVEAKAREKLAVPTA